VHLLHAKEVVDRLDQNRVLPEHIEHVVVAGDEVIVPLLKAQFPERLSAKVIDVLRLDHPNRRSIRCLPRRTRCAAPRRTSRPTKRWLQELIGDYRRWWELGVSWASERVREALERGQVSIRWVICGDCRASRFVGAGDTAERSRHTLAKQTSAAVRFIENPQLLADVARS
jgi:hypothetical protein